MKIFLSSKSKIIDVDLVQLKKMSVELAKQVRRNDYEPEHILYVERAGLLIGYEVARFFNCSISGIHSKRSGETLKSKVKVILRYLPGFVTHMLRRLELKSNIHEIKKNRNVYCEKNLPPTDKRILIIDDAIDTGYSLVAILEFLEKHGCKKEMVKTGVLTTTGTKQVIRADFSLFDQIICAFPWSYDSGEYTKTQKLYNFIKAEIAKHVPVVIRL